MTHVREWSCSQCLFLPCPYSCLTCILLSPIPGSAEMQVMSYNMTLGKMTIPEIMLAGKVAFKTILASSGGLAASLAGARGPLLAGRVLHSGMVLLSPCSAVMAWRRTGHDASTVMQLLHTVQCIFQAQSYCNTIGLATNKQSRLHMCTS